MLGDCLERMAEIPDGSVDAVVTDPPAGIAFMGKEWDDPDSFPLRDRGPRLTGSGNPTESRGFANGMTFDKSRKGRQAFIDFLRARMVEAYRIAKPGSYALVWALPRTSHWTATAVEDAGWTIRDRVTHLFGTGFPKAKSCLKPGAEDWWLAYKPGGKMSPLQIDACRIGTEEVQSHKTSLKPCSGNRLGDPSGWGNRPTLETSTSSGRWPANVVLSHSEGCNGECKPGCAVAMLDEMSGVSRSSGGVGSGGLGKRTYGKFANASDQGYSNAGGLGDSGGASRFFYTAKASRRDRGSDNTHPTVKSTDLMRWLCRLITPPGGTILDPFMGSGSTGKAATLEGFDFIGIERDPAYFAIAERRINPAPGDAAPTSTVRTSCCLAPP